MVRFLLCTNGDVTKSQHELTHLEFQRTGFRSRIDIRQSRDHRADPRHTGRLQYIRHQNVHVGKL